MLSLTIVIVDVNKRFDFVVGQILAVILLYVV